MGGVRWMTSNEDSVICWFVEKVLRTMIRTVIPDQQCRFVSTLLDFTTQFHWRNSNCTATSIKNLRIRRGRGSDLNSKMNSLSNSMFEDLPHYCIGRGQKRGMGLISRRCTANQSLMSDGSFYRVMKYQVSDDARD
jgi:hypothetical protein